MELTILSPAYDPKLKCVGLAEVSIMAILERVWLIHTTSTEPDADTEDGGQLEIQTATERATREAPGLPHNERERDRTDEYEFDFRGENIDVDDIRPGGIRYTTFGSNAWLPRGFWVIGRTEDDEFHVLVGRPDWPRDGWFSTDRRDADGRAEPTRPLNQA